MYIGLDLGIKQAHYAATDNGKTFHEGTVTLDSLPRLIDTLAPVAIGMEYTGRIAEQWGLGCQAQGIPAFILHSVLRKSLTNLSRQTSKTDKADARSIAHYLRLWADPAAAELLNLPRDLFTNAEEVRPAWLLRAFLADHESWIKVRTGAKLRLLIADRLDMPEQAVLWSRLATDETPEEALHKAKCYALEYFREDFDLLTSIPGIGDRTALLLIATLLPIQRFEEWHPRTKEDLTLKNIKRYIGFLPHQAESGTTFQDGNNRKKHTGRQEVRALLTMSAKGAALPNRVDLFARRYQSLRAEGMEGRRAMNRVATLILRVAVSVLRSRRPYTDPSGVLTRTQIRTQEAQANRDARAAFLASRPAHLVPQTEAAKRLVVSRQRVHQLVTSGKLRSEQWEGKTYVVEKYLEIWQEAHTAKPSKNGTP